MKILYVDNYRGFDDTFIPLKSVNFLVGENSTGKTSILSLINLLHSPSFWTNHEFQNEEINLGSFDEISTQNSNKDFFKIGFLDCNINSETNNLKLWLIKFQNNKGIPIISEFRYGDNEHNIIVNIAKNKKSIRYKIKNMDAKLLKTLNNMDFFKKWISDMNSIDNKGFKIIKINPEISKSIMLIRLEIIMNLKKQLDKKDETLDFFGFLNELISLNEKLNWIAPIRAKPKRTYDNYGIGKSPEGDHTPYLLKDILTSGKPNVKTQIEKRINSFGMESGLYESISVKNYGK